MFFSNDFKLLLFYGKNENFLFLSYCRALCHLSLKKYQEAKKDSAEALKLDPGNVKALYRRAQAHKELKVRSFIPLFSFPSLIRLA